MIDLPFPTNPAKNALDNSNKIQEAKLLDYWKTSSVSSQDAKGIDSKNVIIAIVILFIISIILMIVWRTS